MLNEIVKNAKHTVVASDGHSLDKLLAHVVRKTMESHSNTNTRGGVLRDIGM